MGRVFGGQTTSLVDDGSNAVLEPFSPNKDITVNSTVQTSRPRDTQKTWVCPVCEKPFSGLRKLNIHLDKDHGFSDDEETSLSPPTAPKGNKLPDLIPNDISSTNRTQSEISLESLNTTDSSRTLDGRFKLNTTHFQKKSLRNECHTCFKIIDANHSINCRKCGKLHCKKHCRNAIRLNSLGKYDPINGEWCRCCPECFESKPGRNDLGSINDRFADYKHMRNKHLDDSELIILQLDMRLVKLVNGINMILDGNKYSFMSGFHTKSDILKLEKELVDWDDIPVTCSCCERSIDSLTTKKHHCRLCGQYICNLQECSKELPLLLLCAVIESVNEDGKSNLPMDLRYTHNAVSHPDIMIRFCRNCTRLSFMGKKFAMDLKQPLPPLFQNYEKLHNMVVVLKALIPKFSKLMENVLQNSRMTETDNRTFMTLKTKIFDTFALFEKTARQISLLKFEDRVLSTIQQNVSMSATNFIQQELIPLRTNMTIILEKELIKEKLRSENKSSNVINTNRTALEIKRVNADREQLMVLLEQKFIVENMIDASKKSRKFDEVESLKANLTDLEKNIEDLQRELGNDGF